MKCPECVKEGMKSKVFPKESTWFPAVMLTPNTFYDEEGQLHDHSTGMEPERYECSNEHTFSIKDKCWCGYERRYLRE